MTETVWPILSLLIWLPMFAGVAVLILGDRGGARQSALVFTVLTFLGSLWLLAYDAPNGGMAFVEHKPWIDAFGIKIEYRLGVDGISIPLILLNTFMTVICLLYTSPSPRDS